jgi:hypothetical protein
MFIIFGDCGSGAMQCNTMKCVVGCNRNKKKSLKKISKEKYSSTTIQIIHLFYLVSVISEVQALLVPVIGIDIEASLVQEEKYVMWSHCLIASGV